MQNELQIRWQKLWQRIGAKTDGAPVFADLVKRYSEPHRFYHVLDHIYYGLRELDRVKQDTPNADAAETAFWIHDAIYDTKAHDNEERSAVYAGEILKTAEIYGAFPSDVQRLIRATAHIDRPSEKDEQTLVDVDLSILGSSPTVFDNYERKVRREYAWVPEDAFKQGRAAILESFLRRGSIYSTEAFQKLYEHQARVNLQRSLYRLR